jgi:hypothetical protein
MRALTWLLIRWPFTVSLIRLEKSVSAELILRRDCGKYGSRSPHQFRPPPWQLVAILAVLLAAHVAIHLYQHFRP